MEKKKDGIIVPRSLINQYREMYSKNGKNIADELLHGYIEYWETGEKPKENEVTYWLLQPYQDMADAMKEKAFAVAESKRSAAQKRWENAHASNENARASNENAYASDEHAYASDEHAYASDENAYASDEHAHASNENAYASDENAHASDEHAHASGEKSVEIPDENNTNATDNEHENSVKNEHAYASGDMHMHPMNMHMHQNGMQNNTTDAYAPISIVKYSNKKKVQKEKTACSVTADANTPTPTPKTEEEQNYEKWLSTYFRKLSVMEKPLTLKEYRALCDKFGQDATCETMQDFENSNKYKAKDYKSAYLTMQNWCKQRKR